MRLIVAVILFIKVFNVIGHTLHKNIPFIEVFREPSDNNDLPTIRLDGFYLLSINKEDDLTYTVLRPKIAEIKNGILIPKIEGITEILVNNKHNGEQTYFIVRIIKKSPDSFDQIIQKSRDILLGERYYDSSDSLMSNIQQKADTEVSDLWQRMNKEEHRSNLWDITGKQLTLTAHMTSEFERLHKLAAAVMNKHSSHYLNRNLLIDTISGLEWMILNKYNAKVRTYGNWWDWEIGSPKHILNSLIMLYPILSDEEIIPYLNEIDSSIPDPKYMYNSVEPKYNHTATGENMVNLRKIEILQNALRREEKGINGAIEAVKKIFPFVTEGDGFYADGSFLQYKNIASTGTHGFSVLCGVSDILSLIHSTQYEMVGEEIDKVFTWINEAFAPLIYNGMFMDMVRERYISREFDYSIDSAIIFHAVMNIAELSTEKQATVYKKMVKPWISNAFINRLTEYRDVFLARKIQDDSSIGTDGVLGTMFKNYAVMNRVVYRNAEKGFALGISMSSRRIYRYDVYNGENKHGWFTGDGMVYLYNGDMQQFNDNFWATVDPYRLPGITVEKVRRADCIYYEGTSTDFVGGSILDSQTGMVAMDFVNHKSIVSARKSWTVFQNEIIALGSGIKNTGMNVVETIFENRKLNKDIQYKLYINENEVDISEPFEKRVDNVNSIYLESREDSTQSIGYMLLTPQQLTIKVENREGAWSNINDGESPKLITRKYLTIWKTHNEEINDYNYVIYPSISWKEFNLVKPVTLLENTEYVHAVADDEGNLGVTIFEHGNYFIGDMTITQPMVLVKKEFANNVKIAVADPTGYRVTTYNIKLTDKNYEIATIDENVEAVLNNGVWLVNIYPSGKLGQSSTISFTN